MARAPHGYSVRAASRLSQSIAQLFHATCSKASCSDTCASLYRRDGDTYRVSRQADGGSLLLDEIGDMSAHLQAKLLRVSKTRYCRGRRTEHQG